MQVFFFFQYLDYIKLTFTNLMKYFVLFSVQSKHGIGVQLLTKLFVCHLTHQVDSSTLISDLIMQRILFHRDT